ncbi:MAG: Lipoprotein [Candidatus Saccharibacteria bacterium]|nr:Lipoprotein [Candidatus Saccharibacteria bacterium]
MNHEDPKPTTETTEVPAAASSEQSTDSVEATTNSAETSVKLPAKQRPRWLIPAIAIVAILLIGGGIFLAVHGHKATAPASTTKSAATSPKKAIPKVTLKGVSYLPAAQTLGDLHFISDLSVYGTDCGGQANQTNCPAILKNSDIHYYKIGTTDKNQPIVVAAYTTGGETSFAYIAIQDASDHYTIIGSLSGLADPTSDWFKSVQKALGPNVSINTTDTLADLDFTDPISIAGITLKFPGDFSGPHGYFVPDLSGIRGSYFNTTVSPSNLKKLGVSGNKTYYQVIVSDKTDYQVKEIYGAQSTFYVASYLLSDPLITSDKPAAISWSTGDTTVKPYTSRSSGCGSAYGYLVAKDLDESSLITAGTGPNGQTLYQLPTSNPLFQDIYQNDYSAGSGLGDDSSALKNLSVDDFQKNHGVFVAKNALGEYVIYLRSDMYSGSGCGKPVIYLYPQAPTHVNVSVGARINKSLPTYPAGGWQDVLAQPSGQLQYKGGRYSSLFWEGLGFGLYPSVSAGTVVKRADAVATIRQQLAEQGLNQKETTDFLDFWQARLPNTPYIRLAWFNTAQVNQLAPLNITPQPQTLIRVFLDFQGLQAPVALPAQTFQAPARRGFTVVEWGGLLQDK